MLQDSKGLRFIWHLLKRPGEELRAIELVWLAERGPHLRDGASFTLHRGEFAESGLRVSGFTDAGEIMDAAYANEVRQRLHDLENERDMAEAMGDLEAVASAQAKLSQYCRAWAEGIGLGGRHRVAGSAHERARVTVTQAVNRAMRKIRQAHAPLHDHLRSAIRTGHTCVYDPSQPVDWQL